MINNSNNKMEIMMATIEDFIGHAVDKDYSKAGDVFNTLMSDKMQAALDQEKIKVGGIIYNGLDPADFDQDSEEQLEMDLEDDQEELQATEEEEPVEIDEPEEASDEVEEEPVEEEEETEEAA